VTHGIAGECCGLDSVVFCVTGGLLEIFGQQAGWEEVLPDGYLLVGIVLACALSFVQKQEYGGKSGTVGREGDRHGAVHYMR
jgi:hypothetical protein